MDIKSLITQQLDSKVLESIGGQHQLDAGTASKVADNAIEAILSGLKNNAKTSGGANALGNALDDDHDGSILADILGAVTSADTQNTGSKILDHVFGAKTDSVVGKVAKNSGVSKETALSFLAILAPIILGQLGKAKKSGSLNAGGLADLLLGQVLGGNTQSGSGLGGVLSALGGIFGKK